MRGNGFIFLSGRLTALAILIVFQVLIVRSLSVGEYARWALVFALAALMQTAVSFGIPRLIPKYISQAGLKLSWGAARTLAWQLLLFRLLATSCLIGVTFGVLVATGYVQDVDRVFVAVSAVFILVGLVLMDADAMAQALSLQRASRLFTVAEAGGRLALVGLAAAATNDLTATQVLLISSGTYGLCALALLRSVFSVLSSPATVDEARPLDFTEMRQTAFAGYASSMAWFASSPAVVRVIASHFLTVATFAGFAFAQTLVLSFQRYTPGALIFPFVEPNAMRHYNQTGDQQRLWRILSLMVKVDLITIGAAIIGASISGQEVLDYISGGKHGGFAFAIPLLLVYIMASSVYRGFETVALSLGVSSVLLRNSALSIAWLLLALLFADQYGLAALLAFPICDALSRLLLVYRSMIKRELKPLIDGPINMTVALLVALFSIGGVQLREALSLEQGWSIPLAVCVDLLFGLALLFVRPFRKDEGELVAGPRIGSAKGFLR
ncbi:hypothetical protein ABVV53_11935 [Novosphingobium sp. RD2P27]|uniref:O-antigen/teichoic acid export membrane protein n=1 Tax=Novosphingobium kalidii TaxID=3230299 RepID=A0ABV2D2P9_9SPHN